jgi:hypothetical protein
MARKHTATLFVTAVSMVALAFAAGCGGDDTTGTTGDGGPGGGNDVFVPPTDGALPDGALPDGAPPPDGGPQPDAGDGGCDFNAFVTDLITNHTNSTDLPSTDLGEACVDTQTPFPATLF